MKKYLLPILAGVALLVLVGVGITKLEAYVPPPTDQVGGDYAFFFQLPYPMPPNTLMNSLWCPRIEARSNGLVMASLWAKLPNGVVITAQAQAYNFGSPIGWGVMVFGPRIWVLVIKTIIDDYAVRDAGTLKIVGPNAIKDLEAKSAGICKTVANAFFVKLTGTVDGGGLPRSPYTEGGSWPVQEALTCSDGTKYRLQTKMQGYLLSGMNWTTLPPQSSWHEAPQVPVEFLPCQTSNWNAPDAALCKYCPRTTIGNTCPAACP